MMYKRAWVTLASVAPIALLALIAAMTSCRPSAERRVVRIASTPDLAGIGIDSALADAFAGESHVQTTLVVTEEGLIPDLVRKKMVDVVITRSPELKLAVEQATKIHLVNTFASRSFVLVGPERDPAHVKQAASASDAVQLIARRNRPFCSPADVPLFRDVEARLWEASKVGPEDDRRYRFCSGDGEAVLKEASLHDAYTVTDRDTYDRVRRHINLEILLDGTPLLRDNLTVMLVADPSWNRNAEWFVQWLMSARGRDIIDAYRYDGERKLTSTSETE